MGGSCFSSLVGLFSHLGASCLMAEELCVKCVNVRCLVELSSLVELLIGGMVDSTDVFHIPLLSGALMSLFMLLGYQVVMQNVSTLIPDPQYNVVEVSELMMVL